MGGQGQDVLNQTAETAAGRAVDLGGHGAGEHHRLVSLRQPAPQDIETLLVQAAEGLPVTTPARDAAGRLLTRLSLGPWSIKQVVADGGHGTDYTVVLTLTGQQATLQIRCLPSPHVVHVRM